MIVDWFSFKQWSITYRLSLYFAITSLVLITGVGIFLYSVLDRQIDYEHGVLLADNIDLLRYTLARARSETTLRENPRWQEQLTPVVGSRLRIAILNERREVLVATSRMDVPLSVLPEPADIDQRVEESVIWKSPQGKKPYRIATAWARIGREEPGKVLIVLALDVSLEQRLLKGYRDAMLLTLLIGALGAATLGYMITRRGLSPVRRIAKAANAITSTQLDRKLELADEPVELRELAAAFNGMLDRLQESFSRLSRFSSDIAHELRTPINNLMGEAQVALSRVRTACEYQAVLESGVEELERLSRMIENMLFLARADYSEMTITAAPIDVSVELEKLAEFYQVVADESGVRIKCVGNASIRGDPILFRQAISNLLSNAIRHSRKGGEIVMAAEADGDGSVTVSVANSGSGIPREHLHRIFDRFYQVEPSREKSSAGVGLGLALVKTIMRLHGGSVGVVSEINSLTIFTLRFPYSAKAPATPALPLAHG